MDQETKRPTYTDTGTRPKVRRRSGGDEKSEEQLYPQLILSDNPVPMAEITGKRHISSDMKKEVDEVKD